MLGLISVESAHVPSAGSCAVAAMNLDTACIGKKPTGLHGCGPRVDMPLSIERACLNMARE